MLQRGASSRPNDVREEGWSAALVRGPERMFYGLVEFEVLDPDGYRVCVSGAVRADANVPAAREREETAP